MKKKGKIDILYIPANLSTDESTRLLGIGTDAIEDLEDTRYAVLSNSTEPPDYMEGFMEGASKFKDLSGLSILAKSQSNTRLYLFFLAGVCIFLLVLVLSLATELQQCP